MLHKVAATLLILAISTAASAELRLQSFQSGVFQRPDVKLSDGDQFFSRKKEQIIPTQEVPAKLGSKFGIRYQLRGKKTSQNLVTYLYLTPGVVEPDGTRRDKYVETVDLKHNVASHVAAFQFTESYEIVEGIWELLIFVEDRLLIRKKFNVSSSANLDTTAPAPSGSLQYVPIRPSN